MYAEDRNDMVGLRALHLECVQLSNGELLVDVTDHHDLTEVTAELSKTWVWDSTEGPTTTPDEGNGASEWLVLLKARPKAEPQAA